MFRKLTHMIISLLLLTTTMGFSISKHYCGSRLVSISVDHEEEPCCNMGGDCCHNETKVFQLTDHFVFSPIFDNATVQQIDTLFPLFYILSENIFPVETNSFFQLPESPPPIERQTILSSLQTYLC